MQVQSGIFGPVHREIERKRESLFADPAHGERELLEAIEREGSPRDVARARDTLDYLRTLRSQDATHPSFSVYLSHPIRVALFAFRMRRPPSIEVALIGLLHNVYEVAGLSEADLAAQGYSERITRGVRLLTIDRQRETDAAYLARFYGDIEAFAPDLALVRCVDKLDNLLAIELLEDAGVRTSYIDLAGQFVGPMADRLDAGFGRYFREAVAAARETPFRAELRERYDRLVAGKLEVSS